ncbi:hypothetical protein OC846_003383 [Tilletia horrida]|uniref:Uncharacterized protein n=1 Tax=Tilletia horrida TaxID=155126 RepID=A0AAN6GP52_9BASI|nr:hypothetical protein OC845_003208 [Tilletia horrida]KAK0551143.1 hypothetical protein OC846_003383 [Tilletia horrida]KAK0566124.1 hypothetical protein OC861_003418 [Tilletia horrida]
MPNQEASRRSLFSRRRADAGSEHTPLTLYQQQVDSSNSAMPHIPYHQPYPHYPQSEIDHRPSTSTPPTPEELEILLTPTSNISDPLGPPSSGPDTGNQAGRDEEVLETLEDPDEYHDDLSPSNSSGDIGGSYYHRSRRQSRPAPVESVHNAPPALPVKPKQRPRTDSIGASSIASVRSWRNLFKFSNSSQVSCAEDTNIVRVDSVTSIRDLGISAPIAIQSSTSAVVGVGAVPVPMPVPTPSARKSLRARASSPAMTQSAKFDNSHPMPLRNPLEVDDEHVRRQVLQSAVYRASHAVPFPKESKRADSGSEAGPGLRKRSSSIASISSLFGAAIGLSKAKERSNSTVSRPVVAPAPGIALSTSENFTMLAEAQGIPSQPATSSSRKSILRPITVQPAVPAVNSGVSGGDLGCAPKHALASSAMEDGKSSKRWKFRSRRKTAEVNAQTFKAMTQPPPLPDTHARLANATVSPMSVASSSVLGNTLAPMQTNMNGSPMGPIPTDHGKVSPGSSGFFSSIGRWASNVGGRTRQPSVNSALSQKLNSPQHAPASPADPMPPSYSRHPEQLLPSVNLDQQHALDSKPLPSTGQPASNHWLSGLDFGSGAAHSPNGTIDMPSTPTEEDQAWMRNLMDLPKPRMAILSQSEDIHSMLSNNGSAESIVFLIKPTPEPLPPSSESGSGPQAQLSRRSTRDSVRNSMKGTASEKRMSGSDIGAAISKLDGRRFGIVEREQDHNPSSGPITETSRQSGSTSSQQLEKAPTVQPRIENLLPELHSIPSGDISHSFDEQTERIELVEETTHVTQPSADATPEQAMESQQVDPWGSFDANLGGLVADSDIAAQVLAEIEQTSGTPVQLASQLANGRAVDPEVPIQSTELVFQPKDGLLPAAQSHSSIRTISGRALQEAVSPQQDRALPDQSLTAQSINISAAEAHILVGFKVQLEAGIIAAIPTPMATVLPDLVSTPIRGRRRETLSPPPLLSSCTTASELAGSPIQLQGATVEEAVAVTATLAHFGSISTTSTDSAMLVVRNSVEVAGSLTPTSVQMSTPALDSDTFDSTSTSATSSEGHGFGNRASAGLPPLGLEDEPVTLAYAMKAHQPGSETFDQWGAAPNGLILDLSLDGKSVQNFEKAVKNFQEKQRERQRTQTAGHEDWAALSPLLGFESPLLTPTTPAVVQLGLIGDLSPMKDSASVAKHASMPSRLAANAPRHHRSGYALGQELQSFATLPDMSQLKVQLDANKKASDLPATHISLGEFLSELKAPVDLANPPPPLLSSRRRIRSKTCDATFGQSELHSSDSDDLFDSPDSSTNLAEAAHKRRRARTMSASMLVLTDSTSNCRLDLAEEVSYRPKRCLPAIEASPDSIRDAHRDEAGQMADSSFTRDEWLQFRSGRSAATLSLHRAVLDPDVDASRRAMYAPSPRRTARREPVEPEQGGKRPLSMIEDDEERSEGEGVMDASVPRSSTPAPVPGQPVLESIVSSSSSRATLSPSPLRQQIGNESGPGDEESDRSLSTAMARCHTLLDDTSIVSDDGQEEAAQPVQQRGYVSSPVYPPPSLVQGDGASFSMDDNELKVLGACLSALANVAASQSTPVTAATDKIEPSNNNSFGVPSNRTIASNNTETVYNNQNENESTSGSATTTTASSDFASASLAKSDVSRSVLLEDLSAVSAETELSSLDIVEHLLRKAMWARYEKARRESESQQSSSSASSKTAVSNGTTSSTTAGSVAAVDAQVLPKQNQVLHAVSAVEADLELD